MEPEIIEWHPDEDRYVTFDFSDWDDLADDPITSGTITGTPSGQTYGSPTVNADGNAVQVRVTGGTAGTDYHVKCKATTGDGLDYVGCVIFRVSNC